MLRNTRILTFILLTCYDSFERHQYMDIRKLWDNGDDDSEYKSVCDVYGAEHLARLIGMVFHLVNLKDLC